MTDQRRSAAVAVGSLPEVGELCLPAQRMKPWFARVLLGFSGARAAGCVEVDGVVDLCVGPPRVPVPPAAGGGECCLEWPARSGPGQLGVNCRLARLGLVAVRQTAPGALRLAQESLRPGQDAACWSLGLCRFAASQPFLRFVQRLPSATLPPLRPGVACSSEGLDESTGGGVLPFLR